MGLLEDTFKFSTGGNYYGTGGSYYGDQEKKKRDFYSKYKRQDIQPITPKKSLEQIAKESQYGKPTGVLPPNISKSGQSQGRTSDGMDLGKWHGNNAQDQQSWWQKLAGKAGIDYKTAQATWNKKGGFEGLMANPAFTMGLAFMQAGAEGKTLGQGALDNVMKSAGISSHYKRLMEAKSGGVTEVTTGQMDQIKSVLGTKGISAPILRKLLPGNQSEMYQQAVEDIAFKVQKKVNTMKEAAKASGKDIEVGSRLYKKIIDEMIASGEISTKGGINVGGYQIIDRTLESKARGGPVAKGKTYVVGEGGPEYFLPKQSGKILSNDDSRIFAMLLTANPQLQQVSRTRAEKILRNRFPEYFE